MENTSNNKMFFVLLCIADFFAVLMLCYNIGSIITYGRDSSWLSNFLVNGLLIANSAGYSIVYRLALKFLFKFTKHHMVCELVFCGVNVLLFVWACAIEYKYFDKLEGFYRLDAGTKISIILLLVLANYVHSIITTCKKSQQMR